MNKVIWMYWHQGFNQAPPVIKNCVKQWQHLHLDWQIRLLDQHNVYTYAKPLDINPNTLNKMTLAHRSDLIRTQLLIKYGGVWADPTCFPVQKLEDWLPEQMRAGFFFFYKPGRDRIISNWFIAAEKDNAVLKRLYDAMINYWNKNNFKNLGRTDTRFEKQLNRLLNRSFNSTRLWFSPLMTKVLRIYPYMVYHFMLYRLISKYKSVKQQFDLMPKYSAEPTHALQKAGMMKILTPEIKAIIDKKEVPVLKLTWKINQECIPENSNLRYLFNQIENQ